MRVLSSIAKEYSTGVLVLTSVGHTIRPVIIGQAFSSGAALNFSTGWADTEGLAMKRELIEMRKRLANASSKRLFEVVHLISYNGIEKFKTKIIKNISTQ